MNWLQGLIYGVISGLSEFIPVSPQSQQALLRELFGRSGNEPLLDAMIHVAVLLSLLSCCRNTISQIQRDQRLNAMKRRRSTRAPRSNYDLRFVKTATVPMILGMVILTYVANKTYSLLVVAALSVANGIILFAPDRMLHGNKDARGMSSLDSFLTGFIGIFSVFPGISRVAVTTSFATARGADRQQALNWSLLLSIPALAFMIIMDTVAMFSGMPSITFGAFGGYILAMLGAFAGGYCGITIMKFLAVRTGFCGFAYYSWGTALFALILYMI